MWRDVVAKLEHVLAGRTAFDYRDAISFLQLDTGHIPYLQGVGDALSKLGWGTAVVDGFLPPRVFMDFHAHRILPISKQIRSRSQIGYTPIPDVIHEAIGHLPPLMSEEYRRFLERLGTIGAKLPYSEVDLTVYEKQKHLAERQADQQTPSHVLDHLKSDLEVAIVEQQKELTPATLFARFHWWTVEYGLFGDEQAIYGAGLLSSATEAARVSATPKVVLSDEALAYSYDISTIQPQLFYVENWAHLHNELAQLESRINRSTSPRKPVLVS